ncbi:GAF and ANTAR domain-containing protein [Nonomuraea zeae]|uniref:GAF and ANTAR domain-containing protein n=1 Tax=Nonomuraea zeae TaxID=1642303 RepID=A0A5S4GVS7_9ACTN|nr:GAF and ANTAR domain-containing protein [Nonomuraea zeae]TMR37058.1 GAF and ANTAR domain-containing protein [Nonomuraea zeae]
MPADIEDFDRVLTECVTIVSRVVPDSPMVSVTLCARTGLRTVACSHAKAELFDELQSAAGQGPVLDAIGHGIAVTADDLTADSRWRRFTADTTEVRSLYSEPLEWEGSSFGAITLYSGDAGGFADETRVAVRVTADHIVLLYRTALDAARMREIAAQLKEALNTRAIIDQALGIIMAQRRCTSHQAFEILRNVSQVKNVKLYQVAATIVETVSGEPPQRPRFEEPPQRTADPKK